MSYNIQFKVKLEGIDYLLDTRWCNANITWNVRDIITSSTGLEWNNESDNGFCKDIIPKIRNGICELEENKHNYKHLNPKNGLGDISSVLGFFGWIVRDWVRMKEEEPELADVTKFYIG